MQVTPQAINTPFSFWELEVLKLSLCYLKLSPEYINDCLKCDVAELEEKIRVLESLQTKAA